jgi:hypothetical protein
MVALGEKFHLNLFYLQSLDIIVYGGIQGLKTNSIFGASLSIFVPTVNEQ